MKKRIILVGGFHKARALADSLLQQGYHVTAINRDYQVCEALSEIDGLQVIHGDGTKPFILEDADIQDYDIAIALTQRDDDNLVICQLCKKKFNVKKTVALISDPKKMTFFYKMGIDSVVSVTKAITSIIEQQAFMDEMVKVFPISEGRVTLAEILIPQNSNIITKKLSEIAFPKEIIVGCIVRGDQSLIPRGDTVILAGDVLVVIAANKLQVAIVQELVKGH